MAFRAALRPCTVRDSALPATACLRAERLRMGGDAAALRIDLPVR